MFYVKLFALYKNIELKMTYKQHLFCGMMNRVPIYMMINRKIYIKHISSLAFSIYFQVHTYLYVYMDPIHLIT